MALSSEIVSQFAKIVTLQETKPVVTTVTGTAVLYQDTIYVQLDGSDQLTPIASSTAGIKDGDRVTVQIKNHSVTVTGNMSSPSAGKDDIDDINGSLGDMGDQITEFEIAIGNKVDVIEFDAVKGRVDDLTADNVTIKDRLTATEANIGSLEADNATINEKLTAAEAEIDNLDATKISFDVADGKYATIENLDATNANVYNLQSTYAKFEQTTTDRLEAVDATIENLGVTYAKIDFTNIGTAAVENLFAKSGIIEDLVVSEGHITGQLVGVTISGDLIEGNTIKADKLVVLGSDGLYYKLNVNAETVAAEQTEYNSLSGSIITAKSVTAEKISVNDLVAFDATIGGFVIDENSIHTTTKGSVDNGARGLYMDNDGQVAFGDNENYLKYYRDTDGTYKLAVSANAIKFTTSDTTLDETIDSIISDVNSVSGSVIDISQTVTEHTEQINNFQATQEGFEFTFNTLSNTVTQIGDQVTEIYSEQLKYIKFIDGEIWLGRDADEGEDEFKVVISNDRIRFLQNNSEVAYLSNNQLYITNGQILKRLDLGQFAFFPRDNGNLTFRLA